MRFTIKRSKWLRGEGEEVSRLLRSDGKMCCIGQCASQVGIPDERIQGKAAIRHVQQVSEIQSLLPGFLEECHRFPSESEWVEDAYRLNDSAALRDPDRESKLSALAAANGHEFVFVD